MLFFGLKKTNTLKNENWIEHLEWFLIKKINKKK